MTVAGIHARQGVRGVVALRPWPSVAKVETSVSQAVSHTPRGAWTDMA